MTYSPCSFEDMSQNIAGLPILKYSGKRNEILLCTLHAKVHYANTWPRPQNQWPLKRLNKSHTQRFDGKEREDKHF